MSITFYWYPNCGTCRKAKNWLDAHGVSYHAVHIVENPPNRDEMEQLYKKAGWN